MSTTEIVRIHTVYAKTSGMEVKGIWRENKAKTKEEGAILLRFFGFAEKASQKPLNFFMNSVEAYEAAEGIKKIVSASLSGTEKVSHPITHKFSANGQEIITKVVFEQYAPEKFGLAISRDKDRLSVGIKRGEMGLVGKFLEALAVDQCKERFINKPEQAPVTPGQSVTPSQPAAPSQPLAPPAAPAPEPASPEHDPDYDPFQ